MSIRTAALGVLSIALCLSFLGATCGQKGLAIMPGVVNDPGNLSLRRSILSYGTNQLCSEMLRRSVPLKLREEDPTTGRFFPTACYAQELGNDNLMVQFGGYGFAWANVTKRISFEVSGAVEYDHDFLMEGGIMYVYFRQRSTSAASFQTRFVEQPQTAAAVGLPIPTGIQTGESFVNAFGTQLMKHEFARGFTVLRENDGSVQFGLGIVEKGERPSTPYRIAPSGRSVLANERTEVHQNQRDYVGPIEVRGNDMALYLTATVDGAQSVDAILVPKGIGDMWLKTYTSQVELTGPPAYPTLDEQVFAGQIWRRTVALPPGLYYLVFDNSAAAGRSQPMTVAQDDRAALVSFAIELGDAP